MRASISNLWRLFANVSHALLTHTRIDTDDRDLRLDEPGTRASTVSNAKKNAGSRPFASFRKTTVHEASISSGLGVCLVFSKETEPRARSIGRIAIRRVDEGTSFGLFFDNFVASLSLSSSSPCARAYVATDG